jgi:membrane protease subunit HflK
MPWQNQGGPWGGGGSGGGGGGQGPWGRGPSGGGPRQPDIEDMVRRTQDRLKTVLPGGGGWRGISLIAGIIVVIWLLTGFYRVEPGEEGVVLQFGEWINENSPKPPGLHWHLPWPIQTAVTPNVQQVRQIDIGFRASGTDSGGTQRDILEESLMLTRDQNIIDIEFTVLWRIGNAGKYLFNIRDPDVTIKAVAESAMREVMAQTDIQPALTEAKDEVANQAHTLMQKVLDEYQSGILITQVSLQDAQAPQEVIDAFEDVQRAQQDRDRATNEAEAYRNKVIPEARGFAARAVQEAEGYRERVVNEAEGEAQRFISIYNEYVNQPDVTKQRIYLETLTDILARTDKLLLDPELGGAIPYLPLNELRPQGTPRSTPAPTTLPTMPSSGGTN